MSLLKGPDFNGKRVLITGASIGLGKVCAEVFAEVGAKLLITARSENVLEKNRKYLKKPSDHVVCATDLTKIEGIKCLMKTVKKFGNVDVILHIMGGGLGKRDPLINSDDFDLLFRTNIGAAAEINRELIPKMIERKTGNVVMVGSTASTQAIGSVGYNTVKAGLLAYIRSLGRELADTGVIVTGILPGAFMAPNNSWERLEREKPEVVRRFIKEKEPRKKIGHYEEILPVLMFLSSRQATMMTGCCVPIDGGESITYI